jgi:hypothetical protein
MIISYGFSVKFCLKLSCDFNIDSKNLIKIDFDSNGYFTKVKSKFLKKEKRLRFSIFSKIKLFIPK